MCQNNTEKADAVVPEDAVDDIEDIPFQDHDTRNSVSMSSATFVDQSVQFEYGFFFLPHNTDMVGQGNRQLELLDQ